MLVPKVKVKKEGKIKEQKRKEQKRKEKKEEKELKLYELKSIFRQRKLISPSYKNSLFIF